MIQRLLALIFLATLGWLISRLLNSSHRAGPASRKPPRQATGPRSEGTMVRDRVCNKFLPRARALVLEDGDQQHYFCSEECRRRFLTGESATASG